MLLFLFVKSNFDVKCSMYLNGIVIVMVLQKTLQEKVNQIFKIANNLN